jgi:CheY-like chemotaxis protein
VRRTAWTSVAEEELFSSLASSDSGKDRAANLSMREIGQNVTEPVKHLGDVAKGLARNPLGIIALFIVLVYGFASLVTTFASSFGPTERLPLVYFLVVFPVLVLAVFAWLVSSHSGKLFAPADFKDESNYVRMQLSAVASLATAAAKNTSDASEADVAGIVEAVQRAGSQGQAAPDGWRNQILWVDDHPENNVHERRAFEALGFEFSLALSTDEALAKVNHQRFAAIISDMGRREGPREGYVLLDAVRKQQDPTPFFIYASSNAPEHKREAEAHGGQGCTNNPQELFQMVTRSVVRADSRRAVLAN